MPRVLLAWEFGGDLGHVTVVLAIARDLRERGHEPILAFGDLGALGAVEAAGIEVVAAPLLAPPESPAPSPLNAPDILLNLGFGDAAGLAGALAAWVSLLRLVRPQAVVGDYAPTALLAARAAGVKRIGIGNGFSEPPAGDPMPALRPWLPRDDPALLQRDQRLVACVREAFARAAPDALPPARAAEVFEADVHLRTSWAELDPFGPRTDAEYLGPQTEGAAGLDVAWKSQERPRIFAYLKPRDARFDALLDAFVQVGGEAIVAAPGLAESQAAACTKGSLRVFARAVAVGPLLDHADLCIGHAGAGLAAAAMARGVPQALLPEHLEQYLVARRICETGSAGMLAPGETPADLGAWIAGLVADGPMRAAAAAQRAVPRTHASAAERIVRAIAG